MTNVILLTGLKSPGQLRETTDGAQLTSEALFQDHRSTVPYYVPGLSPADIEGLKYAVKTCRAELSLGECRIDNPNELIRGAAEIFANQIRMAISCHEGGLIDLLSHKKAFHRATEFLSPHELILLGEQFSARIAELEAPLRRGILDFLAWRRNAAETRRREGLMRILEEQKTEIALALIEHCPEVSMAVHEAEKRCTWSLYGLSTAERCIEVWRIVPMIKNSLR